MLEQRSERSEARESSGSAGDVASAEGAGATNEGSSTPHPIIEPAHLATALPPPKGARVDAELGGSLLDRGLGEAWHAVAGAARLHPQAKASAPGIR